MLGNYILNISDRIKVICKQLLQNQNMEKNKSSSGNVDKRGWVFTLEKTYHSIKIPTVTILK